MNAARSIFFGILLITTCVYGMEHDHPQNNTKKTFTSLISSSARSVGNVLLKNASYLPYALLAQPVMGADPVDFSNPFTVFATIAIITGTGCVCICTGFGAYGIFKHCCRNETEADHNDFKMAPKQYETFTPFSVVVPVYNHSSSDDWQNKNKKEHKDYPIVTAPFLMVPPTHPDNESGNQSTYYSHTYSSYNSGGSGGGYSSGGGGRDNDSSGGGNSD
jgi:uncharacterized membrane protein YgcG